MKKRKNMKLVFIALLTMAMLVSACSKSTTSTTDKSSNGPTATSTPTSTSTAGASEQPATVQPAKPVTFKVGFDQAGLFGIKAASGPQDDLVAKEIANRTGVTMDIDMDASPDKYKVALASGDLPDIMVVNKNSLPALIKGNNIIPLDDLMAEHGKDILSTSPKVIEFNKKYYSNNTGKLYSLPTQTGIVDPAAKRYDYGDVAINVRYDYYKELGFPEYKSLDDLLPILAQMQKNHPTNAKGQKIYAVSPFFEFGIWGYFNFTTPTIIGASADGGGFAQIYPDGKVDDSITSDTSGIWTAAKFYNKANQLGILDPESFTQKFDNFQSKAKEGRILSSFQNWALSPLAESATDPSKGYVSLPPPAGGFQIVGSGSSMGQDWKQWVITKNCKDPERALDLINFLSSYEGSELLYSGVKGVHWAEKDGKAVVTDEAISASITDPDFAMKTGIGKWDNFAGISKGVTDPKYGQNVDFFANNQVFEKKLKPIEKELSEHFGAKYPGEIVDKLAEKGVIKKFFFDGTAFGLVNQPADDVKRTATTITDYLLKSIPKAVLAKTDADFEKEKLNIINEAKKMGLEKVTSYWIKQYQDALVEAKKYQ